MRFLFTTLPGIGHFHAIVSLAQALQQEGHEVAFASVALFRSRIETTGFHCFPAGLDWLESQAEQAFPEIRELSLEEQSFWFMTHVFAGIAAERMATDLLVLCRHWKPDVIVRSEFEFGGCIAAERLNIPHATVSLGLFIAAEILRPLIGKKLNELRTALGLAEDPKLEMLYRFLYLCFGPPSYQFAESSLVPVFHSLRPTIFDCSGTEELPEWVKSLPERPTVHATLGTIFSNVTEVYLTIAEALADEQVNVILTTGRKQNLMERIHGGSNLHIESYIPHTLLLPYCDVVITHGGAGTTMSVLSHGLPMVIIPMSADHPFHAMRCAALGVACVIKQAGQFDSYLFDRYYAELSPDSIRGAVAEVLNNPDYKVRAKLLCDESRSLPGMERALELLTKLAIEKVPQLASRIPAI